MQSKLDQIPWKLLIPSKKYPRIFCVILRGSLQSGYDVPQDYQHLYTKELFKHQTSSLYFTTSNVALRLDIMTGHSPFSSYSA